MRSAFALAGRMARVRLLTQGVLALASGKAERPWAMCFCPFGASYSWVLTHSPLSKCSNVLVCKVIKKVSYLQSLFVMILQLFSPFASAVQSDSVRRLIGFRPPSDQIPYAARRTTTATYRPKAFHIAPWKPPQLDNCHILLRKCYIHLVDRIILLKFVNCDTNAMK